jgi:hypothetical protein
MIYGSARREYYGVLISLVRAIIRLPVDSAQRFRLLFFLFQATRDTRNRHPSLAHGHGSDRVLDRSRRNTGLKAT